MIVSPLTGGLGNQLFQIFATMALGIRCNHITVFMYKPYTNIARPQYWDNLLKNLRDKYTTTSIDIGECNIIDISQPIFRYSPIVIPIENEESSIIIIRGLFQCERHFKSEFAEISKLVGFDGLQLQILDKIKYIPEKDIRQKYIIDRNNYIYIPDTIVIESAIMMHFRLGDYVNKPEYHPIMPREYYANSLRLILRDTNISLPQIVYFCEEEDISCVEITVNELRLEFPECRFYRISHKSIPDWKQLLLMSLCAHAIIANSTFSWWGAYLMRNSNKMICYPSIWFGSGDAWLDSTDLCPINWYCVNIS